MEENVVFQPEDVEQNKVFGILAYLGLLVLVPIFAAKDSPYARFHANQGLVLLIFNIAANVVINIFRFALFITPFVAATLSTLLSAAVGILGLVLTILGIINACSGEAKKLPVIGGITILPY